MKRKVVILTIIVVCFLLQSTVLQPLALASITPNLLVIVTSSFGFMRGKKEGMVVGFVCGLLIDTFYGIGSMMGFYALVYTLIGYGNGMFQRLFYDEDIKLPLALISLSTLVYGLGIYFFLFMMRGMFYFGYYFVHIIIPELVYTILVTLGLYQIILKVNRRLEADEKRSASKFV